MDEILAGQLYPFRALYWLTSAIGGVALLLTLSGIYGVLSYLVSQRAKEIGIRVALGASTARVAGLVMRQSLRFTLIGTVLGAVAALGVSAFAGGRSRRVCVRQHRRVGIRIGSVTSRRGFRLRRVYSLPPRGAHRANHHAAVRLSNANVASAAEFLLRPSADRTSYLNKGAGTAKLPGRDPAPKWSSALCASASTGIALPPPTHQLTGDVPGKTP